MASNSVPVLSFNVLSLIHRNIESRLLCSDSCDDTCRKLSTQNAPFLRKVSVTETCTVGISFGSRSVFHFLSIQFPNRLASATEVFVALLKMADSKAGLRKPVFTKVDQLRPGTSGHTLTVKVVSTKMVMQKGRADGPQVRQMRIAECLVGDETGMIIFTARNDQVNLMEEGATVTLRNAKIDMFKGSMRLAVDKWGRVEVTEPASFTVKEDNNLSLIEYELVNVVEE
ncbi:hypothetical protein QYF36_005759 [Acer negundo]|nr:hypothetical protein QYF36_005759 [Acer negundo]